MTKRHSGESVGWIGLGGMGGPMATNVVRSGVPLAVYDLADESVTRLTRVGATAATSAAELSERCDLVFACLPSAEASDAVATEVFGVANPPMVYVEHSTLTPGTMRDLAARAEAVGTRFLDAPVSGLKTARDEGRLTVFIGGSQDAFEIARPILELVGERLFHLGPVGSGCVAKLSHNLIGLTTAVTMIEGLLLGVRCGLEMKDLAAAVMAGASGTPRIQAIAELYESRSYRDVSPPEIALRLAVKDLELVVATAADAGMPVRTAVAALEVWQDAAASGLGDAELFAILDYFDSHLANAQA